MVLELWNASSFGDQHDELIGTCTVPLTHREFSFNKKRHYPLDTGKPSADLKQTRFQLF